MHSILNKKDEDMVVLELICLDLIEQLKLTLILIERSKQMKPHLKEQFIHKKQSLLQLKTKLSHNNKFSILFFKSLRLLFPLQSKELHLASGSFRVSNTRYFVIL